MTIVPSEELNSLFAAHLLHMAEEIDLSARYALIDLRERCLFHQRGLGQRARALFEIDKRITQRG